MTQLYTTRIVPTNATATTAAVGYPALNALLQAIGQPWRATDATQTDLIIDLGAALTVRGIGVQDINAAGVTIASSPDNITYTYQATPTFTADRFQRSRGIGAVNLSARYWRIRIAAGTPTDALAYWRIGAVYVFGAVAAPINPQYGLQIETKHADSRITMSNGREAVSSVGSRFDMITGKFLIDTTGLIGTFLNDIRNGVIWLDMQVATKQWLSWPLFNNAGSDKETLPNVTQSEIDLNAREVV